MERQRREEENQRKSGAILSYVSIIINTLIQLYFIISIVTRPLLHR